MRTLDSYRHAEPQKLDETFVDDEPGDYFVSALDGNRYSLVSGPYPNHQDALDDVRSVRVRAEQVDPRAVWYAFGTCRLPQDSGRVGALQQHGILPLPVMDLR